MQDFLADFSMLLLGVISALLILVVLLQRGRGGGLAGAFGGLGGQSAFGTKAGDVFTKITIGLVTAWVLLAGVSGVLARKASEKGDFSDEPTEVVSDGAGASMSASGDTDDDASEESDDATDDATEEGDDAAAPSSESEKGNGDDDSSSAEEPADNSETEKTEAEAAPSTDEKSDTEPESSDSETATPEKSE